MIKINQPIVVEGKYDRIRLSSVIDGVFIETGGFRVFKDKELVKALSHLSKTIGIIVMTDSDGAGFKIRNFLKGTLPKDAKITHVYIPAVVGKEKRKTESSAEGLLGVEGLTQDALLSCFEKAGVWSEITQRTEKITVSDLYELAITGTNESATRRRALLEKLSLPPRLSTSSMIDMINILMSREEFLNSCIE